MYRQTGYWPPLDKIPRKLCSKDLSRPTWVIRSLSGAVYTGHTAITKLHLVFGAETALHALSSAGKVKHVIGTGTRTGSPTFCEALAIWTIWIKE